MTHPACPACRLRFAAAAAAPLTTCPDCGGDLEALDASSLLGFRRRDAAAPQREAYPGLAAAVAAVLPEPPAGPARS
jgi:hypothetical protein